MPAVSCTNICVFSDPGTTPVEPPLPWLLTVVAPALSLNKPLSLVGTSALNTVTDGLRLLVKVQTMLCPFRAVTPPGTEVPDPETIGALLDGSTQA